MTLEEIKQWERDHASDEIDRVYDMDKRTNEYQQRIYQIDDKLFALDFCNGYISEKWGDNGYIRDMYEPYEVEAFPRTVYEYLPMEG